MNIQKNSINISMYTQFYFCSWSTHQNVRKKFYQVSIKDHGTTLTKSYKSICCSKPRGMQKCNFWTFLQQLLKITENYTNEDILHHKIVQLAQIYNTFKHQISNYQTSLLYTVAAITTFIKNTHFPSLFLLPSPFPNTRHSSSSMTHQYNNPK